MGTKGRKHKAPLEKGYITVTIQMERAILLRQAIVVAVVHGYFEQWEKNALSEFGEYLAQMGAPYDLPPEPESKPFPNEEGYHGPR